MKATVNGIQVEGTPKEVHEFATMTKVNQTTIKLGKHEFTKFVDEVTEMQDRKRKADCRIIGNSL